jgi:Nucleotidyl transferase AbiEii toxin, Type IV TA system
LRPTIQIETAVWPLRRPTVELSVISFISEALQRPPEIANIACVSIVETAADKFVGLTRRAGAELAGLDEPDPTLVRHLHDLMRSASTTIRLKSRRWRGRCESAQDRDPTS